MEKQRTRGFLTKKYCLTKCFKRKLSKGWENTIQIIAIFGIIIAGLFAIGVIFYGIGYIAVEWLNFELKDKLSYIELGMMLTVSGITLSVIFYWLYKFASSISKSTVSFIKHRYEGDPFECSIFEECEDE